MAANDPKVPGIKKKRMTLRWIKLSQPDLKKKITDTKLEWVKKKIE